MTGRFPPQLMLRAYSGCCCGDNSIVRYDNHEPGLRLQHKWYGNDAKLRLQSIYGSANALKKTLVWLKSLHRWATIIQFVDSELTKNGSVGHLRRHDLI
jgi:hypothetical protein